MWYQAWIDQGTADAQVTSSSDGGYTWETAHEVDTSITTGDLAQPCTNGTNLGVAADGDFYMSTDLTSANLPGSFTGHAGNITGSTGLVWHIGSQLWIMCGDNQINGYIYSSPDGITWTNRTPVGMTGTIWPKSMDIAHPGYGGYNGVERIWIVCGSTSTNLYYSDDGTTWLQDSTVVPTTGLNHIVFCPSVSTNSSSFGAGLQGCWLGMDATDNLWMSNGYGAGNWYDSGTSADWIWKTDDWAGYGTASATATNLYQFVAVTDTGDGFIRGRHCGVLWNKALPMMRSSSTVNKARFTWGNGVILFDREDGELMIGRYGPIT
jgi:hypothetical protein